MCKILRVQEIDFFGHRKDRMQLVALVLDINWEKEFRATPILYSGLALPA